MARPVNRDSGQIARAACLLCAALLVAGCASVPPRPSELPAEQAPRSVVFVADGAGNFQAASRQLRRTVRRGRLPIAVQTHEWSHGYGRIIADQVHFQHALGEGQRLAARVKEYHDQHPNMPIYLFGHSAGSAVVLAAAEALPAGVVDRVVLLSPSLSASYDVCPTLRNVRRGLHVFYSPLDWWYLGIYTHVIGTCDRRWNAASGLVGFRVDPQRCDPADLAKLHQRSWQPLDEFLGNFGGHYGSYQPNFLRVHVMPLLLDDCPALPLEAPEDDE